MNESLMRTVTFFVTFVAYCDDDVLDPDAAVSCLEQAAALLKPLTAKERAVFRQFLAAEAERVDEEHAERYRTMLERLGLGPATRKKVRRARSRRSSPRPQE
jgi:hypothetical protein